MATPIAVSSKLNILQCAATGAALLVAMFVICWATAAAGYAGGSHMYLQLFTLAPVTSLTALGIGLWWSVFFGALGGALTAFTFNSLAFLARR
jgi:hypothetical protein